MHVSGTQDVPGEGDPECRTHPWGPRVVSETPPGLFLCSFPGVRVICVLTAPHLLAPLSVSPLVTHLSSVNLRLDVGDC